MKPAPIRSSTTSTPICRATATPRSPRASRTCAPSTTSPTRPVRCTGSTDRSCGWSPALAAQPVHQRRQAAHLRPPRGAAGRPSSGLCRRAPHRGRRMVAFGVSESGLGAGQPADTRGMGMSTPTPGWTLTGPPAGHRGCALARICGSCRGGRAADRVRQDRRGGGAQRLPRSSAPRRLCRRPAARPAADLGRRPHRWIRVRAPPPREDADPRPRFVPNSLIAG